MDHENAFMAKFGEMPALVTNSLDLAQIAPSFKLHRLNLHNIY
jgi:hypothetical protein